MDTTTEDPWPWQKKKCVSDLLAAAATNIKNITSHLSLEAGVSQSSAVKILHKRQWHRYTTQMYHYRNEDNHSGESNCIHWITQCCKKIQIQTSVARLHYPDVTLSQ
jgi:hypothetical protein